MTELFLKMNRSNIIIIELMEEQKIKLALNSLR
jgi:hypothetical protein